MSLSLLCTFLYLNLFISLLSIAKAKQIHRQLNGDILDTKACTYQYNGNPHDNRHFLYNLSPYITASDDVYLVIDKDVKQTNEFRYYFNICDSINLEAFPDCAASLASNSNCDDIDALAYEYYATSWGVEECYRLSDCNNNIMIGMLDYTNPFEGIFIKYNNGDSCSSDKSKSDTDLYTSSKCDVDDNNQNCKKSMRVNIHCNSTIHKISLPQDIHDAGCGIEFSISHAMGCPIECNNEICNMSEHIEANEDNGITIVYNDVDNPSSSNVTIYFSIAGLVIIILISYLIFGTDLLYEIFGWRRAADGKGFYQPMNEGESTRVRSFQLI